MESFYTRYKNALVLMLVLLAQIVLLAMQVRRPAPGLPDGHNVRLWRYAVSSIIAPPERLAHNIGLSVRGVWSKYVYLRDLRQQNDGLQAENDRLRLEQASLAEDAREGQRLREMLDFRGQYIDKTLPAQVIGTSGTDQARVILIDRGSKDGLKVQMPVITPDGIIGKLKNVFPSTSQVLLISDQTSGTGVMLETTRVRGVMKGNASGQPQIINISPDDRIKPGEPVMTSGGDQVYPAGLPVGVVDKVVAEQDTPYVNVIIKPNANLSRLEEVLVVTELSDKMPFSQEKDMMQSEVDALALKQRAADVLSERLPSLHDDNAPETAGAASGGTAATATTTAGEGDPARPMRPPQPLHPDRYSPGAPPPAESLTPGASAPLTHRAPSSETSDTAAQSGSRSTPGATAPTESGRGSNLVSRFPAKPSPVIPAATNAIAPPATGPANGVPSTAGSAATGGAGTSTIPGTVPATRTARISGANAPATTTVPGSSATPVAGESTPRRPPAPTDDSGGILTPAGMSAIGSAPRVRVPVAAAGTAAGPGTGTGAAGGNAVRPPSTAKPALPKPAGSRPQTPTQQPAAQDPNKPKQPPAATPPGGV